MVHIYYFVTCFCQIANMADAAIARREARRRKILENSHNRLQLIAGKNDNETCQETSTVTPISIESTENSVPKEISNEYRCFSNNGMINTVEEPFNFLSTNYEHFATGDGDVAIPTHELTAFMSTNSITSTPEPIQAPLPLFDLIANYKYDIVLLSLLIQMLHCFSVITFDGTYFFLPVTMYLVTKYFWFPKPHNSHIANVLLLLNGMSASRVQKIISITQYLSVFSQDICIFLFTTICIQSLLQILTDNLG